MIRVIASSPLEPHVTAVELSADDLHHLRVRRVEPGEEIVVLDGVGHVGSGRLERDGNRAWVTLQRVASVAHPAKLMLLVGAGDRDRFATLVEKCVETGVTDLVPIATERTEGVATRLRETHFPGLERRALEALKQCGGAWGITLHPVVPLDEAIGRVVVSGLRWLADAAGIDPAIPDPSRPVAVLIGPEGGLTLAERKRALAADFTPVRLGPRTLRFETAALAAAVLAGHRRKETHG